MSLALIVSHGAAAALLCAAIVSALGAACARALFAMCMHLIAALAFIAAALAALRHGPGALLMALAGVGLAPVLLLSAVTLTARATHGAKTPPWILLGCAAPLLAALCWKIPAAPVGAALAAPPGLPALLAALMFAAAAGVAALLGYGERGALDQNEPRR